MDEAFIYLSLQPKQPPGESNIEGKEKSYTVGTYPSLNEVNFVAFGEASFEYHNELYGFIEAEGWLNEYKERKSTRDYVQINKDGTTSNRKIILTEYIRHQIHHPENDRNEPFISEDLIESIEAMRAFITTMRQQNSAT